MRERMPVPAALLERLPKLKLICITGANNRTLDQAAAAARGVEIRHTRQPGTEHPTAEITWALILAAARNVTREAQVLREGGWQETLGFTLHGRTLGLVGLGRIGKLVAGIGRAFGMEIIAWSPNLTEERAADAGVRMVSKAELMSGSDVISLHLVLSDRTRGVIGRGDIALMRKDAILVNSSRGPLVDEAALLDALQAGRIGGAGLDVFEQEPLPADHPFRTLANVAATPHLGYVSRESYAVFFADTVENIEGFLAGRPVRVLAPPTT
jgi:phosphoglycerate dehydrogenase-like enzyme